MNNVFDFQWRCFLAEAIGTFFLVFAACGAVISDATSGGAVSLAGIALIPGLMTMVMIVAFGAISGAHFNPAVTLALAATRRFEAARVVPYLLAQFLGAMLATASHAALYGQAAAASARFGAHVPNVPYAQAFGFELIFAFLLMWVILAATSKASVGSGVPPAAAIGATVALAIYLGGPISGASMNPIRSLAPALFAGGTALVALPIYLIAPVTGSVLATLAFDRVNR